MLKDCAEKKDCTNLYKYFKNTIVTTHSEKLRTLIFFQIAFNLGPGQRTLKHCFKCNDMVHINVL